VSVGTTGPSTPATGRDRVTRPGASRLVGVDVARGVAVLGMFAAHLWPRDLLDERVFDGRSAILFATLAGVSLGLVSGGVDPTRPGGRGRVALSVAIRAVLLIVLGLLLQAWNAYVLVILPYYGVMFLLLLAVLWLPRRLLVPLAAVLALAAPLAASLVPVDSAGDPSWTGFTGLAADALLVGAYPALVWLPFLLAGLVAARSDLARPRTARLMVVVGTAAAVVGYGARFVPGASGLAALDPADHEGMPAEIVGSGGVALAVIGLLLLATGTGTGRVGGRVARVARVARTLLSPLAAVGAQPLTVYTLHLLLTAPLFTLYRLAGGSYGLPLGWLVASVIGTLVYAVVWRRFVGRGPLERLVAGASRPWARRDADASG
jgi:uncharacterized membrane protein YeiB